MPIDKLGKPKLTDVDPSSITFNLNMQRQICCSECGETQFTLYRVRDTEGRKVKPAKYICPECLNRSKECLRLVKG